MNEVRIMKNGKRFNRTTDKYADKKMAKRLYDEHEKPDPRKTYEFVTKLRTEGSKHRFMPVVVCYSPVNILDKDEFDLKINSISVDGQPIKFNIAEKLEAHSAALNDYFTKHAA